MGEAGAKSASISRAFTSALEHHRAGRWSEAETLYRQILSADPRHLDALCNLGVLLRAQRKLDEAIQCWHRLLETEPDHAATLNNLGNAYKDLGRLPEAIASFRRALQIKPDSPGICSNLLVALNYDPEISAEGLFAEHKHFAERFESPLKAHWQPHANSRNPDRPLKIGYVSGDFRNHAVAKFIEPILAYHDKARFEVYCYNNHVKSDAVTSQLQAHADHWKTIDGLSDDRAAQMIRSDQIDVLVDLSGHTGFNRLLTFARKPAPVQVTWIGYPNTTGLEAMGYRFTDAYFDPPGQFEKYYSEELVRLPASSCFSPPPACPEVKSLPALENGHITFASLSRLYKVNDGILSLWARILAETPRSRLLILDVRREESRSRLASLFQQHGISGERLVFYGEKPFSEYLALHNEVDIGLDTYPFGGGTTTNLGLWMGVPFVTRRGQTTPSRIGSRLLSHSGLADLIADSPEQYVDTAVTLARDITRLKGLREGLRQRMSHSPLVDAKGLTAAVEDAYRQMWATWCGGQGRPETLR